VSRPIVKDHIRHLICFHRAQFMLSELGHVLDSANLETTATLLPNGDFDLHTPHPGAAK
jgi:hypothetical protein